MRIDVLCLIIKFLIEQHVQPIVHALSPIVSVHFPLGALIYSKIFHLHQKYKMNDAQLQARLRHSKFDGAAGGRPKKLLSHVLKLASMMETTDNIPEFEATYTQFLKDLTLYEFNMGRL